MYDDDDGDENEVGSVGSANLYARHSVPWAERLRVDRTKPKTPPSPSNVAGQDEVRWGDKRVRQILVPGGATGTFGLLPSFDQIVEINRPARAWNLLYSVELLNPYAVTGTAPDEILVFFSTWFGVGASRIRLARNLNIPLPAVPIFADFGIETSLVEPGIPAQTIVIAVNQAVTIAAPEPSDRIFNVQISAQAAPVMR